MKITGNNSLNAITQTGVGKVATPTKTTQVAGQFDKINFSSQMKLEGDSRTQQEVASKLSHEVRTHNTTSKITELREQVESGTYQADARETASRMLLIGVVE